MGALSLQKLSANWKNAQLSTGPKTALGKAKSALQQSDKSIQAVTDFKQTMERCLIDLRSSMSKSDDEIIEKLMELCQDDVEIADILLRYLEKPTQEDAKTLDDCANSDDFWAEIMDSAQR